MDYRNEHCRKLFAYSKEYMNKNGYKYSDILLDLTSNYHKCDGTEIDDKQLYDKFNKYLSSRNISVLLHLIRGLNDESLIAYNGWNNHMTALRLSHNKLLEEEKSN